MKTLQKHPPRIICVISCGLCGLILLLRCTLCMFRQSSTAPSHPAWHLPRRPRSLDSGQTAGQTPCTASASQRSSSCIRFKLLQIHSHRFICAVTVSSPETLCFLFVPRMMKKFSEKFKEVKDAARLAREKSQDKELANSALSIAAPQVSSVI